MSYSFDGTDDRIYKSLDVDESQPYWFLGWAKPDTGALTTNRAVVSHSKDNSTSGFAVMHLYDSVTTSEKRLVMVENAGAGWKRANSTEEATENAWQCLRGRSIGTNRYSRIGYNGGEGSEGSSATPASIDQIAIGVLWRSSATFNYWFKGKLSRVACVDPLTTHEDGLFHAGYHLSDIPGVSAKVRWYKALDTDASGAVSAKDVDGSGWTVSGAAYSSDEPPTKSVNVVTDVSPFDASEADITAYDSTKQTYATVCTLPAGRVLLLGIYNTSADAGSNAVKVTIQGTDGTPVTATRTLNKGNLSSLGTYNHFGDGWCLDVPSAGNYICAIEVETGSFNLEGFRVASNAFQQGGATHCSPRAVTFDDGGGDAVWSVGLEEVTGDLWVLKDDEPQEMVIAGIASDRNEGYHNSAGIQKIGLKLFVAQAGHGQAPIKCALSDTSGDFSSSVIRDVGSSGVWTYINIREKLNGEVLMSSRGSYEDTSGRYTIVMESTGVDDMNTSNPSWTYDLVIGSVLDWQYHKGPIQLIFGAVEIYVWLVSQRNGDDQGEVVAFCYDPNAGSHGEFYSLNGHDADNQTSRGTEASPRFSTSQVNTRTDAGDGIELVGANGTGQRFLSDTFRAKVTSWPSGGSNPKVAVFFFFFDSDVTATTTYGTTYVRDFVFNDTIRDFSADGELDTELSLLGPNSTRLPCLMIPEDDDPTSDNCWIVLTDRGDREITDSHGDDVPLYWDWGAPVVKKFYVEDIFSETRTYSEITTLHTSTTTTIQQIDYAGDGTVVLHDSLVDIHGTHRTNKPVPLSFSIEAPEDDTVGPVADAHVHGSLYIGLGFQI